MSKTWNLIAKCSQLVPAPIRRLAPAPIKRLAGKVITKPTKPRISPRNSDFIPYIWNCLLPDVRTVLDVGCGRLWDNNPPSEDYLLTVFSTPN